MPSRRTLLRLLAALPLAAAPLAACATIPPATTVWRSPHLRDHPLVGRLWAPAERRFLSEPEAMARLAAARFVLLGERHDNPDHHRLQARALAAMIAAGRRPAVAWEMIDASRADALAAFLAAPDPQPEAMGPALAWADSGWPAWEIYQPIAEVALAHRLPMRPANLARETVMAIARRSEADSPPDSLAALPPAVAEAHRAAVIDGHCGLMPAERTAPMVRVQLARDAAMADAMAGAPAAPADGPTDKPTDGAVLIAGAGHVRRDIGVPWVLAGRGLGPVVTLACIEVAADHADPAAYALPPGQESGPAPYDLLWFTPAADLGDPCADLKARLGGNRTE